MTVWTCGECEATTEYEPEFPDDVAPKWYCVETQAMHLVMCSPACLITFARSELALRDLAGTQEGPKALEACRLIDALAKLEEAAGDDALWTDDYREVIETAREALAGSSSLPEPKR